LLKKRCIGFREPRFFKNLIEASSTDVGRKAIEEYAYSDPEVLPILSNLTSGGESQEAEQQIESASSQELSMHILLPRNFVVN